MAPWAAIDASILERALKFALSAEHTRCVVSATDGRWYGAMLGPCNDSIVGSDAEDAEEKQAADSAAYVARRAAAVERMKDQSKKLDALQPNDDDYEDADPFATITVDMGGGTVGGRFWPVKLYNTGQLTFGVSFMTANDGSRAEKLAAASDPEAWQRWMRAKETREQREAEYRAACRAAAGDVMIAAKAAIVCKSWRESVLSRGVHLLAHALVFGPSRCDIEQESVIARVPPAVRACVGRLCFPHPEFDPTRDWGADESQFYAETARRMSRLLQAYPRLQTIDNIQGRLPPLALTAMGAHARHLRVLKLGGMFNVLDAADIEPVLRGCTQLESVSLTRAPWVDNKCLELLGKHCVRLEHLDLSGNPWGRFTHVGIGKLKGCPHLTSLDVSGAVLSVQMLRAVAKSCTRLEVLSLEGCTGFRHTRAWPSWRRARRCATSRSTAQTCQQSCTVRSRA